MATNGTPLRRVILAVVFLMAPGLLSFLWAQDSDSFTELRFIQRLVWSGDEFALRYEVIIEREEEGEYSEILRESTRASFIEIPLPPANYRYRVISHDYLDRPAESSEWVNLEIRPLLPPELYDVSPARFHLKTDDEFFITLLGKNFYPDTELYLLRPGDAPVNPVKTEINEDGSSVFLLFDSAEFAAGDYMIVARNFGGTETYWSGITVIDPDQILPTEPIIQFVEVQAEPEIPILGRPLSIHLSAAWIPMIPFYGEAFGEEEIIFPGAALRLGIFPGASDSAGLEVGISWYAFSKKHAMTAELNFITRKSFLHETMTLCFRIGIGYTIPLKVELFPEEWNTLNTNIGFSLQWRVFNPFNLEIGLDYTHVFTEVHSGALKPWIGVGIWW